jgi:hypothetical protein
MTKNTKINTILKFSIVPALLLTLGLTQTKTQNILDLFDGVVKGDASTGNIIPSRICATNGGYQQRPDVTTVSDVLLSTPLNTRLVFNKNMFSSNFNPALYSGQTLSSTCVQNNPNYGNLYQYSDLYNAGDFNGSNYFYNQSVGSYLPPTGFKGVACFNAYFRNTYTRTFDWLNFGAIKASAQTSSNPTADTNVAQVKIQVGGSTSTTCGPDPIVGQVGDPFPSFYTGFSAGYVGSSANLKFPGITDIISGSILNNVFIPNPGQIIPLRSNLGLSEINIELIEISFPIQTNFTAAPVTPITPVFSNFPYGVNLFNEIYVGPENYNSPYSNQTDKVSVFCAASFKNLIFTDNLGIDYPFNCDYQYQRVDFSQYIRYPMPTGINTFTIKYLDNIGNVFVDGFGNRFIKTREFNISEDPCFIEYNGGSAWLNLFGTIHASAVNTCPTAGGTISINTVQTSSSFQSANSASSISSISSSNISSISSQSQISTKALDLVFTRNYRGSGALNQNLINNKDDLDISDPYICKQQIITGNVKYTGDKSNLNPVILKIKNFNTNQNSYNSQVTIDSNGDYKVDVKDVNQGDYQVEFSISDKSGNSGSGSYTFEKKEVCDLSKAEKQMQQTTNNTNLTRTGGQTSSFTYAFTILTLIMFIGSQVTTRDIK